MVPDRDDPMLDACLDEVLAGRSPPDLTARILQAWAARGNAEQTSDDSSAPLIFPLAQPQGAQAPLPVPPPVLAGLPHILEGPSTQPLVELRGAASGRERRRQQTSSALAVGLAAGVIGLGVVVGMIALLRSNGPQIAHSPKAAPSTAAPRTEDIARIPKPVPPSPDSKSPAPQQLAVDQPANPQIAQASEPNSAAILPSSPVPAPSIATEKSPPAVASAPPNKRYLRPSPDAQIVSFVNAQLPRIWNAAAVKPTAPATDAEWCQRLFVRVLGRAPTADELKGLADDKAANRREKLVERLLTEANYGEEYARHWSVVWTNVFIGKSGSQPASLASREELEKYFHAALVANKPFHDIAQELLTATGSAKPGAEDYNPAVNFLLDGLDATAVVATSRVSRVLLGHQLQCAQCHNHPSQDWTQEQFWALNGFLRQMRADQQGGSPRLVNVDFRGQRRGSGSGEVFYETPDGLVKTVLPRFIDGTEIPASGELAAVDRRRELARLVVQSDDLPKAIVNRVWAALFDYGFTRPVDDLGPHRSPSAPAVLDRLATEFAAHDYDLKRVIRWTVLSDPFNRSSTLTDLASKDMPEEGEPALFSRYYARPPRAAEAFNSLAQAARIRRTAASDTDVEKARIDWLQQFNRGATKKGKAVGGGGSPLMIKTNDLIHRPASGDPTGLVKKVASSSMPFEKKVEHLFLAAIARPSTPREQRAAAELLRTGRDNQVAALEDIWWALQNSSECVIDQ